MAADVETATVRQITQNDLKWLACPVCKHLLLLKQTPKAVSHPIECIECKRMYPVVDGLAVLLADRAAVPRLESQPV